MKNSLTIIILAAGKGTRMKSKKPKVLHKIANKEMILHVLDTSLKLKPDNVYIVLGKNSKLIKNVLPKNTKIIIQNKQLGTADALLSGKNIIEKIKGKLLVLYGDVPLLEASTLKKIVNKRDDGIHLLSFDSLLPKGYGRIKFEGKQVSRIVEEKNLKGKDKEIKTCYSGIFCGKIKDIFELLGKVKKSKKHKEFLLTDIFTIARKENMSVIAVHALENEVMGVNNLYQLALAEKYFQKKLRLHFLLKGVNMLDPETVFLSSDTKIGKNVIIGPNNYFGEKVIIKNDVSIYANNNIDNSILNEGTTIGPFSRLRNNTLVGKYAKIGNYVEIKNSKVGNNTKINHLTYIGDAIIGNNTNIGAGTITCNYDGKNKNKTVIGNNVFIGSNCALIAPIKIDDQSFVAAGSTISDSLKKQDFSIARAKQKIIKEGSKKFLYKSNK